MKKLMKTLNQQTKMLCKIFNSVGASAVLFDKDEIIFKEHYGYINKETKLKTDDDSFFMIGSNTKVLTSLSIFKLLEENKLTLEDDIKKYIPEFSIKSTFEYEKITIANLLMHRSGIQSDLYNYIFDDTKDYHDIIDALKDTYLTSVPGTMYSYSNLGYTLLGIIIERISGLSYVDFINEHISKPLNIDIKINPDLNNNPHLSLSYDKKHKPIKDLVACLLPAGSNTYMKIIDFIKIGQLFLNNGTVNDIQILKPETIELMKQLNLDNPIDQQVNNAGYGLLHNEYQYGNAGKVYGHGGDTICHHSFFSFIPDQNISMIVFTNTENAIMLSRVLGITILSIYLAKKGVQLPRKISNKYKHIDMNIDNYLGKYATNIGILDFKKDKKNNLTTIISKIPVKLIPCEDGFLQAYPIPLIYQLPFFKNQIKNIRLKLINYNNEDVLLLEQIKKNQKASILIGSKYIPNDEDNLWYKSLGEYELINYHHSKGTIKLELDENKNLRVIIDLKIEKITKYLRIENDHLSFVQGFGRETKDACFLEEKENKIYITCNGIQGVKNKE